MVRTLICSRSSSLVPSKPIEILRGAMAVGPFLEKTNPLIGTRKSLEVRYLNVFVMFLIYTVFINKNT